MKKKLTTILVALCSAFAAIGFASCDIGKIQIDSGVFDDYAQYEIELDTTEFNPVMSYQGEFNYDGLTIYYESQMQGGVFYETEIPVRADMVKSGLELGEVGDKELVIEYAGHTWTIPYTVKYRVDYVVNGELFDTQYVFDSKDVIQPEDPEMESGYEFVNWKTELPKELNENLTIEAHYHNHNLEVPALKTIKTTYEPGATLADIASQLDLLSNENGKWAFVKDESTLIGGAGTPEFEVCFVPATPEMPPQENQWLKVNVAKKEIKQTEFTPGQTSFIYDGEEHFPASVVTPVEVNAITPLGVAQTEAGEYSFAYVVEDENYFGTYIGRFEITKPDVTITVEDVSIKYPAAIPEISYEVEGFDNVALLDITISKPSVNNVGTYDLIPTVGNKNVNVTYVKEGTLTISKGDWTPEEPVISSSSTAIYRETLSTVLFEEAAFGEWEWVNSSIVIQPYTEVEAGIEHTMQDFSAMAVFTPENPNYNKVEKRVWLTSASRPINKRPLIIEIGQKEYTYTGAQYALQYEVYDQKLGTLVSALEGAEKGFTVSGNTAETEAGDYDKILKIVSDYYTNEVTADTTTLKINQATPDVELRVTEAEATVKYNPYLKLENSNIVLKGTGTTDGEKVVGTYAWKEPSTDLHSLTIDQATEFTVVYTPSEAYKNNYTAREFKLKVTVTRAYTQIINVEDSYTFDYDGNPHTYTADVDHNETPADGSSLLTYVYKDQNGKVVNEVKDYGVYKLTITAAQTAHYVSETKTVTITVNQAENEWSTKPYLTDKDTTRVWTYNTALVAVNAFAKFGNDTMEIVYTNKTTGDTYTTLPKDANAGVYEATVTVPETDNYKALTETVSFEITKAKEALPTVVFANGTLTTPYQETDQTAVAQRPTVTYTGVAEYTVVYSNVNSKNANMDVNGNVYESGETYTVTVTLTDDTNYVWGDTESNVIAYNYYIKQATNAISGLTIAGWSYLEHTASANSPTIAGAAFGRGSQTYSYYANETDANNKTNAIADVTQAEVGAYYVRADIAATANYVAAYAVTSFEIAEAVWTGATFIEVLESVTWENGLKLSSIDLPEGYTWDAPNTELVAGTSRTYPATYKIENYQEVKGTFQVIVNKRPATVSTAAESYAFTYGDYTFTLDESKACATLGTYLGVSKNHGEAATFTYEFIYAGAKTPAPTATIADVGTYTLTIKLSDSAHYDFAEKIVTITIEQKENTDTIAAMNATYGDTLGTLVGNLPTTTTTPGAWGWKAGNSTLVGNAGVQTHVAVFTPNDTVNYAAREVEVTVNVAAKTVYAPTVSNASLTYNKNTQYAAVTHSENYTDDEWKDYYTVTDNGGVNIGEYTVTVALKDTANYVWDDKTPADKETTYAIVALKITAPAVSFSMTEANVLSTIYNKSVQKPYVIVAGESITVHNDYNIAWENSNSVNVGEYTVTFALSDTNYVWADDKSTENKTVEYTIEKKAVGAEEIAALNGSIKTPTYNGAYLIPVTAGDYEGYGIAITGAEGKTLGVDVGSYTVTLAADNSGNYKLADGYQANGYTYTIGKKSIASPVFTATYANDQTIYVASAAQVPVVLGAHNVALTSGSTSYTVQVNGEIEMTATPVDTYVVTATLADFDNCQWNINDSRWSVNGDTLTYTYTVTQATVNAPTITEYDGDDNVYDGEAKFAINTVEGAHYTLDYKGDYKSAGTHTATLSLENSNYAWGDTLGWTKNADGTLTYTYYVEKATVTLPEYGNTALTYTGEAQTVTVTPAQGTEGLYDISGNTQTNAGEDYSIELTLKDPANYKWADSNEATIELTTFDIAKAQVTVTFTNNSYVYDGKTKSATVSVSVANCVAPKYTINNNSRTDVGETTISVTLADTDNYTWKNGISTGTLTITQAQVDATVTGTYTYNGGGQTATLSITSKGSMPEKGTDYTLSGDTQTNAGTHTITVNVLNANYAWSSTSLSFTIDQALIDAPTITEYDGDDNVYDGEAKFAINTVDGAHYTLDYKGDYKSAGTHTATLSLENSNYAWGDTLGWTKNADGTLTYTYYVEKATVALPEYGNTALTYTGKAQTVTVTPAQGTEGLYDISGNTQTNAGENYSIELTLKDPANYKWADSNEATIELTTFDIAKAEVTVTFTNNSYVYDGETKIATVTVTDISNGNRTITSGYTVTGNDGYSDAGNYTLTVNLGANYTWEANASNKGTLTIAQKEVGETDIIALSSSDKNPEYTGQKLIPVTAGDYEGYSITIDGDGTSAGDHKVTLLLVSTNYKWYDTTERGDRIYDYVIKKKSIELPTLSFYTSVYNGATQTPTPSTSEYYDLISTNEGRTDVGESFVTFKLNNVNYKWSDGNETLERELSYTITKATVTLSAVTINGWTYESEASTPVATATVGNENCKFVTVEYKFATSENGEYNLTKDDFTSTTDIGTYYVKAYVAASDNYDCEETAAKAFTISAKSVDIKSLGLADTTATYNGNQLVPALTTGDNGDYTLNINKTANVEVDGQIVTNAGTYDVTLTLDNENYVWVTNDNYDGTNGKLTYTYTIGKAPVNPPDIDSKEYNGQPQKAAISDTALYKVLENDGGTDEGEYNVILQLQDSANYAWINNGSTLESDTITLKFYITATNNAWTTVPYIIFNENIHYTYDATNYVYRTTYVANTTYTASATAQYGNEKLVIKYTDGTENAYVESSRLPTDVGTYYVVFSVEQSDDYGPLNRTVTLIVEQQAIDAPALTNDTFEYSPNTDRKPTVSENAAYIVTYWKGETQVEEFIDNGDYTVKVELISDNYKWSDNTQGLVKTYNYTITKVKVSVPTLSATKPSYNWKEQSVTVVPYQASDADLYTVSGTLSATNVATYTVTLSLVDKTNYVWDLDADTAEDQPLSFTITPFEVENPVFGDATFTYSGSAQGPQITNDTDWSDYCNVLNGSMIDAGNYTVTVELKDKTNYVWKNGGTADITKNYAINAAPVTRPTITIKTYTYDGKTSHTPTVGHNVSNPNTYYIVSYYKKNVDDTWTQVTANDCVNAGAYQMKVTLTSTQNYKWDDNSVDIIVRDYSVGKTTNEWTTKPSLTIKNNASTTDTAKNYTWTYGDAYTFTQGTATFFHTGDSYSITYYETENGVITGEGFTAAPEDVGSYAAVFDFTVGAANANNYDAEGMQTTFYFTIVTAKVTAEIKNSGYVYVYDGGEKSATVTVMANNGISVPYTISGDSATEAGTYNVIITLTNANFEWANGEQPSLAWTIAKDKITAPSASGVTQAASNSFSGLPNFGTAEAPVTPAEILTTTYNEGTLTFSDDIDTTKVTITAEAQPEAAIMLLASDATLTLEALKNANAGTYIVTATITDDNYMWPTDLDAYWHRADDGTLKCIYIIKKVQVTPTLSDSTRVYDGTTDYTPIKETANCHFTVTLEKKSGDVWTSANDSIAAGEYRVIVTLETTYNHEWCDLNDAWDEYGDDYEETLKLVYYYEVKKATVALPEYDNTALTYTGAAQTVTVTPAQGTEGLYDIIGNTQTNAGEDYSIELTLKDPANYMWENSNEATITLTTFDIAKAQVTATFTDGTHTYNEKAQSAKVSVSVANCVAPDYTINNNSRTDVGETKVTVTLTDTNNYEWATNKTAATIEVGTLKINAWVINAPTIEADTDTSYDGEVKVTISTVDKVTVAWADDKEPVTVGTYTATASLPNNNYAWGDTSGWTKNTDGTLTYKYVVTQATVNAPTIEVKETTNVYSGNAKFAINTVEGAKYTVVYDGDYESAGTHTATITLNDPTNYKWGLITGWTQAADYATSLKLVYTYDVEKATVALPEYDNTALTYTGKAQTVTVTPAQGTESLYDIIGNTQTNAGEDYSIELTLKLEYRANYKWADSNEATIELTTFDIAKAQVTATYDKLTHVYSGSAKNATITVTDTSNGKKLTIDTDYTVTGNSLTNVGTSTIAIALKDTKNYAWADETNTATLTITQAQVEATVTGTYTYNGGGQTATLSITSTGSMPEKGTDYTLSGDTQTNAGTHTITVNVLNANYAWSDTTLDFTIAKATVTAPDLNVSGALYYQLDENGNGKYQLPIKAGDMGDYTVTITAAVLSGDNNGIPTANYGIDAGKYTVTVSLKDTANYEWSANNSAPITREYTINKANNEWTTAPSISNYAYTGNAPTYTATPKFGTVTVTYKGFEAPSYPVNVGSYTAYFSVAGTDNYAGLTEQECTFSITQANYGEVNFTVNGAENLEWVKGMTIASAGLTLTGDVDIEGVTPTYTWDTNEKLNAGENVINVSCTISKNYDVVVGIVTIMVEPKPIAVPKALYNGQELNSATYDVDTTWTLTVAESDYYEFDPITTTNAGSYTLTLTLNENCVWSEEDFKGVITFNIARTTNNIGNLTITGGTYDGEAQELAPSISADYTTGAEYYYLVDGEYTETAPTNAGKYTVKVIIPQSTNYNENEKVFENALTIEKATVQKPVLTDDKKEFDYNIDGVTATVTDPNNTAGLWEYVEGFSNTQTAIGTHTVKVQLADSDNYRWIDDTAGTVNEITLGTFKIKQPPFTATVTLNNTVYGTDLEPTPEAKLNGKVVSTDQYTAIYQYSSSLDGDYSSENIPENVGTYYVKAVITMKDGFLTATSAAVMFNITPVAVSVSDSYTSNADYFEFLKDQWWTEGDDVPVKATATINGVVTDITAKGTFDYNVTFASGSQQGTVTAIFTVNDNEAANYTVNASYPLAIKIQAVAYIGNAYYGTLESAVAAANTSVTNGTAASIYVLPDLRVAIEVTSDLTLKTNKNVGVTLTIPFNDSGSWKIERDSRIRDFSSSYADSNSTNVGKHRVTLINLRSGADIKVESASILHLGGEFGQYGIVATASGVETLTRYCEINLGEGSSIIVDGKFYCHGYVKEEATTAANSNKDGFNYNTDDLERLIQIKSGYIETAMAIYNMPGLSALATLNEGINDNGGIFPLNIFDFPNIQTYTQIDAGAEFYAVIHMTATSGITYDINEMFKVVGASNAMFNLKSGNFAIEYCPENVQYTTNRANSLTKIFLNGNLDQGSLTLKIATETVTTNGRFLPISYKFNVYIGNGATYSTNYKMKFLPGSMLQIDEGGTVEINSEVIFHESSAAQYISRYVTDKADAVLINNGTIKLLSGGKIGAFIQTTATKNTAKIDFTACTSSSAFTVTSIEGTTFTDVNRTSSAYFKDENAEGGKGLYQFKAPSELTSVANEGCWSGDYHAIRTLEIVVPETTYEKPLIGYQLYASETGSDSDEIELSTGIVGVGDTHDLIHGYYFKIVIITCKSAVFEGGHEDGEEVISSKWYLVTADMTIVVTPLQGIKITVQTKGDSGNGGTTFKIHESATENGPFTEIKSIPGEGSGVAVGAAQIGQDGYGVSVYIAEGHYFKITYYDGAGRTSIKTITIKVGPSEYQDKKFSTKTAYPVIAPYIIYFDRDGGLSTGGDSEESDDNCVASGTLITLADGTQKKVEDLTLDDVLLVFNHETGEYEAAGIIFIEDDGVAEYNVINLKFSDGTLTRLIYEHALFDLTLNKYVYITERNYSEFVGHEFAILSGDSYEAVMLTEAYVTTEYTGCYSLVTVYHLNYFIDGLFSMPGGIEGLFNFFEYGEGLVYDEAQMQADIEKYGLYTYEDFAEYLPYEVYAAFPAPYLKVAVGKGMVTFEEILGYIEKYLEGNGVI